MGACGGFVAGRSPAPPLLPDDNRAPARWDVLLLEKSYAKAVVSSPTTWG